VPDLELRVGDVHELELPGRGSAGYSWAAEVDGPEGVLAIGRAPSEPAPRAGPPVSGSLPERFELVALAAGRVRVRLALGRSWEDEEPLEERSLDVVVA
jgi:Chagasin family peptidase inhibitor I42